MNAVLCSIGEDKTLKEREHLLTIYFLSVHVSSFSIIPVDTCPTGVLCAGAQLTWSTQTLLASIVWLGFWSA